jgi:hypothetical protein
VVHAGALGCTRLGDPAGEHLDVALERRLHQAKRTPACTN